MRLKAAMFAILAAGLMPGTASAFETYSTAQFHHVIAQAVVPDRNNEQLYFSIFAGTVSQGDVPCRAFADGIYYQYSRTVEIEIEGKTKTLAPGDGIFLAAGTKFTIKSTSTHPSPSYLLFLLSATPEASATETADGGSLIELYRSPSPVPGLMHTRNLLSLTQVPVPAQSGPDPLHRRTGAALHYILSGMGAESAGGRTIARGPGSVSYEPAGYVYQMSNPGLKPLIYLLFNVNPKGTAPVVAQERRIDDPSRDPHLTVAMYCVAISMILTLVVSSGAIVDHHRDRRRRTGRDDDEI